MKDNGKQSAPLQKIRCAIYCRKSSEEGLEQDFNSLDAQRDACEAYITSQRHEGWILLPDRYDDGGFSGGNMNRPGLQRLLSDVETGLIDCVVVYKVDRLSRSLMDFSKIVDIFESHQVAFISITQSFNTTSSIGRLTLNMLLSFAQFEREIIGERIRDKFAASKRKGKYMGGTPILGYDVNREKKKLVVNKKEAELVNHIFQRFIKLGSSTKLVKELNEQGCLTKKWKTKKGTVRGGLEWNKSHIYRLLNNHHYIGEVTHKDKHYPGEHEAIVPLELWDKVQAILAENHKARAARTRTQTPALLKGLIFCGDCGCSMGVTFTRKNGRMYRYYLCVNASKRGYDECTVRSVSAGTIEDAVIDQMRAIFKSPELIASTYRKAKQHEADTLKRAKDEQIEHQKKLTPLKTRFNQIIQLMGDNGNNSEFARELQKSNDEIASIEQRLQELERDASALQDQPLKEKDVVEALEQLDPLWEQLFPVEQARITELLIEKIVIYPYGLDVQFRSDGLHSLVTELKSNMPVTSK